MKNRLLSLLVVAAAYAGFAFYLYRPYLKGGPAVYLHAANSVAAAVGCFLVGRRWIGGLCESLFAGALYGFGPFVLSLAQYHPAAGSLAAAVAWCFLPAALVRPAGKWRLVAPALAALPFLVIIVFFQLCSHGRLFAVPAQARLQLGHLVGLAAPLVAVKRNLIGTGLYHVPLAPLLIGVGILARAKRFGVIIIFVVGVALACAGPVLEVSSLMWLAVPALCCSILAGAGLQALVSSGPADRGWVLAAAGVMAALAVAMLVLAGKYFQVFAGLAAGYARLFMQAGYMYITAVVALLILFFLSRAKLRLGWLRRAVLCVAIAVDLQRGAVFVVDYFFQG